MEKCNFIEKNLMDYLFEEIDMETRNKIELHLQKCQACQSEILELKATISLIKSIEEKEPARLLYFRRKNGNSIWKYLLTAAACFAIAFSLMIIIKQEPYNNDKIVMQTDQLNILFNQALKDLEIKNKLLIDAKFQELEKRLIDYQNKRFNVFTDEITKQTKDLIYASLNQNEQNRMNDYRKVSDKIEALNQLNEYERQRTLEILNYLINASATREKY